jgi:hypothetical protein
MAKTHLEHQLWDLNRVSRRAVSTDTVARKRLRSGDRVGDVGFVVGRVEVLAVPASA